LRSSWSWLCVWFLDWEFVIERIGAVVQWFSSLASLQCKLLSFFPYRVIFTFGTHNDVNTLPSWKTIAKCVCDRLPLLVMDGTWQHPLKGNNVRISDK
jgi:hypothetical protein